jgi:hypothetical protein
MENNTRHRQRPGDPTNCPLTQNRVNLSTSPALIYREYASTELSLPAHFELEIPE